MSPDSALWYAGLTLESAVILILLQRRIYRMLPVFFIYTVWTAVGDVVGVLVSHYSSHLYFRIYMTEMPIDSLLQFGVIVELAWSVLRPIRSGTPRNLFLMVVLATLVVGLAAWPVTGWTVPPLAHDVHNTYRFLYRLIQTFAILRILFFFALAGFSQMLGVGWRDRELQVATGLGFYSLISVGMSTLRLQLHEIAQYRVMNRIIVISYLLSLVYWGISFLQKEAARQQFDPRMQSFLLTVAGAARTNRVTMEDFRKAPKP